MKKTIISIFILCVLITSAYGLTEYTGMPSMPYIIFGQVTGFGQGIDGAVVEISNKATGYTETFRTNGNGYWQQDSTNWLSNSAFRRPIDYNDEIKVTVKDPCGTGDTCSKTFKAYTQAGYESYASINLQVTGAASCPSCGSCPPCGSGGGGGGCYIPPKDCTVEDCEAVAPIICKDVLPIVEECPPVEECPTPPEPECPEPECPIKTGFGALISSIAIAILGMGGGIKMYRNRKGEVTILHRHRGILMYHNPNIQHRNLNYRHAALDENEKQYLADINKIENDGGLL